MASKIPGYHGQLLEIDLTTKSTKTVDIDPKLARDYVGGKAMGGKLLLDAYGANWAKIDPFSPEAQLLLLAGPYVGFLGCKANAVFKSPQTFGIIGAQGSGDFISEVRFCGYDGVVLKGKASSPTYLTIFDDKVEFKDASKMWGKEIRAVHEMITAEYGNQTSQYYIGPAGENLVRFAAIITEWYRAAGRGGGGAVMGSKNLKAIVCKGTGPAPDVADQKKLFELMAWARKNLQLVGSSRVEFGTASGILNTGMRSSSEPVRNWQSEWHDHWEISGQAFAAEHWVRRYWADYGCTVACSKLGRVKYGKRAGTVTELPDYEAGALLGTNFGLFDINEIAYTSSRPDELGFDLISIGNVCSFACEAQEKGILTAADLGGIELKFGEADGFVKLMDLIAYRKGEIPTLLGEGLGPATKKLGRGTEKFAMQVKNIEMGAHGGRSLQDRNELSYSVSSQGGDHTSTATATGEDRVFRDSVGECSFQGLTADQEIEWLQAITGFGITKEEAGSTMMQRWTTMFRISILASGWTYKDDVNPPRWYEPLPEGPYKGMKTDKAIENQKKQAYYKTMGWDTQGVPTSATLKVCGFETFESVMAPLRATTT
jgi:aldehyde:ferredoxin oxidoreductase